MLKHTRYALIAFLYASLMIVPASFADSVDESSIPDSDAKEQISGQPVSSSKEEASGTEVSAAKEEASGQAVSAPLETSVPPQPSASAPATPSAGPDNDDDQGPGKLKIKVGGGAYFLHRKNYRLIQPQNEREAVARQTVGDPFEYDQHGLGAFGNVALEHPINDCWSIGAGFLGATMETSQFRPVPGGGNSVGGLIENASVIPLLNNLGAETGMGAAVELGGDPNNRNATVDTNFKYDSQQYDVNLDLIREKIFSCKDFRVDGLVGFGYTRINQDTDLHTRGINVNNIATVETNTSEALRDNLYGGRVGFRTRHPINNKLAIFTKVIGGFYSDSIRYEGHQEFSNAAFVGFVGNNNFEIQQNLSESRFVPRLEAQVAVGYQLTRDLSIAASYRFDSLWEVSNADHPTVRFNNVDRDVINRPVQIGAENLTQHFIELKLVLRV